MNQITPIRTGVPRAQSRFVLPRTARRIRVVDVGANPIGGAPPYAELLAEGRAEIIGFEPNLDALAKLHATPTPHETYLPHAVGDGGTHSLQLCFAPGMNSLLHPDPAVLALFHGFPNWGLVTGTERVQTVRMDDMPETEGAQMIKLDIQGAELMVLQNATARLASTLLVQTEVEFLPIYQGQPLFAEMDIFLRGHGFRLHRFHPGVSRVVRPLMIGDDVMAGLSQLVWADAIFIRDLTRLDLLSDAQLLTLATLLHHCYRSVDVALHLLCEYDRRTNEALAPAYLADLQAHPPSVHLS